MLECLQHQGQMCVLLWGASMWQSAGDRKISSISWGIAFWGIVRKEIHVSELAGAYGHPAEAIYLLWSVLLSYKIQCSGAPLGRGHFSLFRFDLSLTGFRKYFFFFPFWSVRGVALSPQGFSDVFCMSEDARNIRQGAVLDLKSGHWHFLESFSLVRETKCRQTATWRRKYIQGLSPVPIMERYFIIITTFSDAINFMTHTPWHKTNKTTSAFVDLAIIF